MNRAAAAGLVALLIAGCAPGALTLDTAAPSRRSAGLDFDEPLQGQVTGGHACFWVQTASDGVVSLVWPEGYVARDDPLRVEDDTGQVVARVGDTPRRMVGTPSTEPGCQPGSTRFVLGLPSR